MKQRVLVIDIGGTNVKLFLEEKKERIPSGPWLTPDRMASHVLEKVADWEYDVISIGFPGRVVSGKPSNEPYNLADGWLEYDFTERFQRPVRIINDASMQALGNYEGGRMLFVGLGTSMGAALIVDNVIVSLEPGCLPHPRGRSMEEHIRRKQLERIGRPRWRRGVLAALPVLRDAFVADYVVVGGGNRRFIAKFPDRCRRGRDRASMHGGIRLWHTRLLDTVYLYQPTGHEPPPSPAE
jgi:hypothetical protein